MKRLREWSLAAWMLVAIAVWFVAGFALGWLLWGPK